MGCDPSILQSFEAKRNIIKKNSLIEILKKSQVAIQKIFEKKEPDLVPPDTSKFSEPKQEEYAELTVTYSSESNNTVVSETLTPDDKNTENVECRYQPIIQESENLSSPILSEQNKTESSSPTPPTDIKAAKHKIYTTTYLPSHCIKDHTLLSPLTDKPTLPKIYQQTGRYCPSCGAYFFSTETYKHLQSERKQKSKNSNRQSKYVSKSPYKGKKNKEKQRPTTSKKENVSSLAKIQHCNQWWENVLIDKPLFSNTSIDSLPSFSTYTGKGKNPLSIAIGIDFGASTTKVLYRYTLGKMDVKKETPIKFALPFSCEEGSNSLLALSQVSISSYDRISIATHNDPKWATKLYFKARLVSQTQFENDLDEIYYAIFFLAVVLKYIEKEIMEKFSNKLFSTIDWHINMGMPVTGSKGTTQNIFTNILYCATHLKDQKGLLDEEGVSFSDWKKICKLCHSHLIYLPYLNVQPEVYAEALEIFSDSAGPRKCAMIVDIGSSTLDFAFIYVEGTERHMYIPLAEVVPMGIELVAATLVQYNPTSFLTLQAAKEYLQLPRLSEIDEIAQTKKIHPFVNRNVYQTEATIKIIMGEKGKIEVPIFFLGGGKDILWYQNAYKKGLIITNHDFISTVYQRPTPDINSIPEALHHRFQVAKGLTNFRNNQLRLMTLPEDYLHFFGTNPSKEKTVNLDERMAILYGK
jgi:hypothetical protein